MIKIISRLADGSIITDVTSSPITSEQIKFEFDEIYRLYGSRPVEIELFYDEGNIEREEYLRRSIYEGGRKMN